MKITLLAKIFASQLKNEDESILPSIPELRRLFEEINEDLKGNSENEEQPVPLTDWEYYAGQIENIYFIDEDLAIQLAKALAEDVKG